MGTTKRNVGFTGEIAKADPYKIIEHALMFHSLGSVLNIAQIASVREKAMQTFKFKREADQLQKIAETLLTSQLGSFKVTLDDEFREHAEYERGAELYRVIKILSTKNAEFIKAIADELHSKNHLFMKSLKAKHEREENRPSDTL